MNLHLKINCRSYYPFHPLRAYIPYELLFHLNDFRQPDFYERKYHHN